jgi:PAS domain S-box-containing protein
VLSGNWNITEQKKANEALTQSEKRFRHLSEATFEAIAVHRDGVLLHANEQFYEMCGYEPEELVGRNVIPLTVAPESMEIVTQNIQSASTAPYDAIGMKKDGTHYPIEIRVKETEYDGKAVRMVAIRDITERKRAEERINASLKEKEVLLSEIHHRVKNNLQTIVSLLNMSSMQADTQEARDLLREARAKVFTMALIHTQLYQEKQFNQIDMGKHVRQLINHLGQTYIEKEKTIRAVVEASDVRLSINQAIPCGLVLNELVSNAFKHAFEDKHDGRIQVSLRYIDTDMVGIKVKDDGIGIPEDVDIGKPKTLGLELVHALVKQLMGVVQFSRDNGTEVNIQFRALKEEEADA